MKKLIKIIFCLPLILYSCTSKKQQAVTIAKEFVKQDLISPSSAIFPKNDEITCLAESGDSIYRVTLFVDSKNTFGTMIRNNFDIHLRYLGGSTADISNWIKLKE